MSQSKDNKNHKKLKSSSYHNYKTRNNNSNKNGKSPRSRETRSTQTHHRNVRPAERPEVEVKITDYTCSSDSSAMSLSRGCSGHSGPCPPPPPSTSTSSLLRRSPRLQPRKTHPQQPNDAAAIRAQVAAGYESSSDSDNMDGRAVPSYDFLEGTRIVTSLTDLRLSDSDDEPNAVPGRRLIVEYSNEDKLPKFL